MNIIFSLLAIIFLVVSSYLIGRNKKDLILLFILLFIGLLFLTASNYTSYYQGKITGIKIGAETSGQSAGLEE